MYHVRVERLVELVSVLQKRDQTLTYSGFEIEELRELTNLAAGADIDRIVPMRETLRFQNNWDDMDLLQEFCRRVLIQ